jgi:cytochrome c heme-lyase
VPSEKCPVDHSKLDKSSHPFFNTTGSPAPPTSGSLNPNNHVPTDLESVSLPQNHTLPKEREISSIPRGGDDVEQGERWVYPSQQMFFNAMKRKNWNTREDDMAGTICGGFIYFYMDHHEA